MTPTPATASDQGISARFGLAPVCVLAACLAAGLGLWHMGLCWPDATTRLRDDAFYEFAWAANVAAGRGPSVSDGVATSGVQLLWSLLLVPVAAIGGAAALPVAAPILGALLHAATAFAWWRHVRDRTTAACLALCWLGNPLLLRECGNGQESALAGLLASLLWFGRTAPPGRFAMLAIVAALARTDLLALVGMVSLWRMRRHGATALVAPALAFAVASLANLALAGSLLQDSALPMAWLWHENLAAADPAGTQHARNVWWFLRPVLLGGPFALVSAFGWALAVFVVVRPLLPAGARALPALLVGCASAVGARDLLTPGIVALLLAVLPAAGRRAVPTALLAAMLGLAAIVALHWGLRWYPRDYYLVPLAVVAAAAVQRCGRHRLLLLAFAAAQCVDFGRVREEPLAGQAEMQMAGQYLGELLPPGERVGCFNSGLVTFHADVLAGPERRLGIVNLDGVVDARSFAALRTGELGAWL
ncbi:MAG: hypothetical protein JNK15_04380, partial [Planctomycetes bacterium]|nr:hypothetical protein [Planctomycetota bacterium]